MLSSLDFQIITPPIDQHIFFWHPNLWAWTREPTQGGEEAHAVRKKAHKAGSETQTGGKSRISVAFPCYQWTYTLGHTISLISNITMLGYIHSQLSKHIK